MIVMTLTIFFSKNTILMKQNQTTQLCWQVPLQHFFSPRIVYWAMELKKANKIYKYLINDYFGGVKTK